MRPTGATRAITGLVAVSLLVLTACGDDSGEEGVASLDDTEADTGEAESDGGDIEERNDRRFDDASVEFAECMGDQGFDISLPMDDLPPDPPPADDPAQVQAREECDPILDEAIADLEIDPEMEARFRDQETKFAECMRDRGYNYPDPPPPGGPVEEAPEIVGPPDADHEADFEACSDEAGMEWADDSWREAFN